VRKTEGVVGSYVHALSVRSAAQPPLASGVAKDHFQDRGPCMEMYPWRVPACLQEVCIPRTEECPRSSSSTVCIDWRCGAAESADISRPAELQLPRSHST